MTLNEFQKRAMTTCTESSRNFAYMFLNLVGEMGEFASKIAKAIRKETALVDYNQLITERATAMTDAQIEELKKECGDIMWQLFGLIDIMGWDAEDIAEMNLAKLAERKKNGTIVGSGDGVTKEERNEK